MAKRKFGSAWEQTQKEMKSDFLSLKTDGEKVDGIFVGEPFTRVEKGKQQGEQRRAYFPILTRIGLQAWGVGKKVTKTIGDLWPDSENVVFTITRHGEPNNTETTYTIEKSSNQDRYLIQQTKLISTKDLRILQRAILQTTPVVEDDMPN